MAQIGLNIFITGLTGKLIIRWVKSSSPLAQVGRSDPFDFPYDDVYVINDLSPVVYTVQLWRSDDGVALSQLIKDWSIDASKQTTTTVRQFQYVTDRGWNNTTPVSTGDEVWSDPTGNTSTLVDERLNGFEKNQLLILEAGYGPHIEAEYDLNPGGGIVLLGGKTFDSGVAWVIQASSIQETTISTDTGSSRRYKGVEIITDNRDFFVDDSNNLYGKLCLINGLGNTIEIDFQDFDLIPDDTYVTFQTQLGSQKYLVLKFDTGNTVRFLNKDVNIIYIAKCEKISLYFFDGLCYIEDYDGQASERGSVFMDYDINRADNQGNLMWADESTGEISKSDMPGLYDFILGLSGDAVCPLGVGVGQWSYVNAGVYPNKRKYGIDTVTEKIRVPHLSGVVQKANNTAGVYEPDELLSHDHILPIREDNPALGFRVAVIASRPVEDITSSATATNVHATQLTGGSENRVKSVIQKPYIRL